MVRSTALLVRTKFQTVREQNASRDGAFAMMYANRTLQCYLLWAVYDVNDDGFRYILLGGMGLAKAS